MRLKLLLALRELPESSHSKFSRKILYEGMRFPLKALGKRIRG